MNFRASRYHAERLPNGNPKGSQPAVVVNPMDVSTVNPSNPLSKLDANAGASAGDDKDALVDAMYDAGKAGLPKDEVSGNNSVDNVKMSRRKFGGLMALVGGIGMGLGGIGGYFVVPKIVDNVRHERKLFNFSDTFDVNSFNHPIGRDNVSGGITYSIERDRNEWSDMLPLRYNIIEGLNKVNNYIVSASSLPEDYKEILNREPHTLQVVTALNSEVDGKVGNLLHIGVRDVTNIGVVSYHISFYKTSPSDNFHINYVSIKPVGKAPITLCVDDVKYVDFIKDVDSLAFSILSGVKKTNQRLLNADGR